MYIVKAAETHIHTKICTFSVDEIDYKRHSYKINFVLKNVNSLIRLPPSVEKIHDVAFPIFPQSSFIKK